MFKESFIDQIIKKDLSINPNRKIITRFPPEPNGHLHLGHIKSVSLNMSMAERYGGVCNFRFDDTNPDTIQGEFYQKILEQLEWLGFDFHNRIFYTSDYFSELYDCAKRIVAKDLAYVCFMSPEELKQGKGNFIDKGTNSIFRNQHSIEKNLELLEMMKDGKFADGECTLRAKLNMSSGNLNLRDPVLYRIKTKNPHLRTGHNWHIYPSYAYSHPIADAIEHISHSICTLEFQDQTVLYDWILQAADIPEGDRPKQIAFSRLKVENCITSKRKIKTMISLGQIKGWDDPRLATVEGLRNRGYTQSALLNFCYELGISKNESVIPKSVLEQQIRKELDIVCQRRSIICEPLLLKVSSPINLKISIPNHPSNPALGTRDLDVSHMLWIEKSDFVANTLPNQRKLSIGGTVRLLGIPGIFHCYGADASSVLCHYEADDTGIKPQAVLHWVDASSCIKIDIYNYQSGEEIHYQGVAEPSLAQAQVGDRYQAYREGYIYKNLEGNHFVFTVPLRSNVHHQTNQ